MKITLINGSMRKGSTYHMAHILVDKLKPDSIDEFFLPGDMPHFCVGCNRCFMESEKFCPHYEYVHPIEQAMERADVIIMTTPVYVMRSSGQMKTLLDHFGYRFMAHRPSEVMFSKVGVALSTAAGGGIRGANKDITTSMAFWGMGKTYSYGKAIRAVGWNNVSAKRRNYIEKDMSGLARKISGTAGNVRPSLKVKLLFNAMRHMQKGTMDNPADKIYWEQKGWLGNLRPW